MWTTGWKCSHCGTDSPTVKLQTKLVHLQSETQQKIMFSFVLFVHFVNLFSFVTVLEHLISHGK